MPFQKTHGMRNSPEYGVWAGMLNRCRNPRVRCYPNYGGRGIKVCDRWLKFENFFADMGSRIDGMTIERINNNGDYTHENCRWAKPIEQYRNRRDNVYLTFQNRTLTLAEWGRALGFPETLVRDRRRAGWPVDRILTTPKRRCQRRASV